jgi:hypothetical protein
LIDELISIIGDYRVVEVDADHVARWLSQFGAAHHDTLLRELIAILSRTYFSRDRIRRTCRLLASRSLNPELDSARFWANVPVLDLGVPGHSQELLHGELSRAAFDLHGSTVGADPRRGGEFVLFDDFLLSGSCAIDTLRDWIADPEIRQRRVHLVFLALHTRGQGRAHAELTRAANEAGKTIDFIWWHALRIEDHPGSAMTDVFRGPIELAAGAGDLLPERHRPTANDRPASPTGRAPWYSLLETEFVSAGFDIMSKVDDRREYMRPLGYQGIGSLGFGTPVASYRSCPNHAPLALWFGDTREDSSPLWNHWYPLLPRDLPARFFQYDPHPEPPPPPSTPL